MRKLYIAIIFFIATLNVYGQTITMSSETNSVVGSTILTPGATTQNIYGIKFAKTGSPATTITGITVNFSSDATGKFTNIQIWNSTNNNLNTSAGFDQAFSPSSFNGTSVSFSDPALLAFSTNNDNEWLFLTVDVVAGATGTETLTVSNTDIIAPGATVTSGTVSYPGTPYTFLTTSIASLNAGANNIATSPLVASSNGKAVFGFSLTSGGTQTITAINVQLSSDPSGKLSSWSLVRSTDSDFSTSGDNTTIGGLTFTPSATQVAITGLSESITSTTKNYFLVANVNAAVTGATASITPSLGSSNITASTGAITGSASGTTYSFAAITTTITSLNSGANNVASSPLIASTNSQGVFGFSLSSNSAQTVSVINVQLSSDPTNKWGTFSLVRSTDADFSTSGDNTTIAGLTFTPTATQVGITGLSEAMSGTAKNYFLVVNVDPSVTGATTAITPSLGSSDVTVNTGVVSGSATGTAYSFAAITTTITSLNSGANNIASSPLIAGSNGKGVFGFSLSSNGSQTVSVVNVQLSSDPTNKWGTFSLVRSTDADFSTTGDNTTIGGLTFTPTATQVGITGLAEAISGTAKNYFLVVNVDPSVTGATTAITPSLGSSNVTVNTGIASGSATGTAYSFVAITTTIASLNSGANNIAASPLVASSTGKGVFGFSLSSNSSQTVSVINVQLSSDPTSKWGTFSLVRSTDADFSTTGDNTTIGGLTFTPTATQVGITGLSEAISGTAKNYFLVVNVDPSVTAATTAITPSLGSSDVTVNTGIASGSATGTSYSFVAITTTIASLNSGANNLAASPLLGGSNGKGVFGFSLSSNGSQTVSVVNVQLSSDPTNKWGTFSLVRSTDADFSTTGDNTTIGGLTFTPTATQVGITGLSEAISGTAKNYFLVINVDPSVTGASTAITPSLGSSNVTVSTGIVSGSATGTSYSFQGLQTTITGSGSTISMVEGSANQSIFTFSAQSNGAQTLSQIDLVFSTDISAVFNTSNFVFKNGSTVVGTPSYTAGTKTLSITGISVALSSSQNFTLFGDLLFNGASSQTLSLSTSGVTVTGGGTVNSFTTVTNTLNVAALTTTVTASGSTIPLVGGATGQTIFSLSAQSTGSQTLSQLDFVFSTDISSVFNTSSFVFKNGVTTVGTPSYTAGTKTLSITGIAVGLSSSQNFTLKADVLSTAATSSQTISLSTGGVTVTGGGTVNTFTTVSNTLNVTGLAATLSEITAGTAPVTSATVLSAGSTAQVLTGFSVSSTGTQQITAIDFNLSGLGSQLTNISLYKSSSAGSVGSSIATSASGNFTGLTQNVTSTVYYYLVADISQSATSNTGTTPAVTTAPTEANITFSSGSKNTLSISRTFTFNSSQLSTISLNGGTSTNIAYGSFLDQGDNDIDDTSDSKNIATFRITDPANDPDNLGTTLTNLTLSISNYANIDRISLFDGNSASNTEIASADQAVTSGTVSFSGLSLTANDNGASAGTHDFTVRVSFKSAVTDNAIIQVTITSATASNLGSGFAAANAGGASSGGAANNIVVTATKLIFVDPSAVPPINIYRGPISATPSPNVGSTFSATVYAVDANKNLDLNQTSSVTLSVSGGAGTLSGGSSQNLSNGAYTFSSLSVNLAGTYDLNATSGGGLTTANAANSTSIVLNITSLGVAITKANLTSCMVGSTNIFTSLPNLVLTESDPSDFTPGTNLTFLLILPGGWEFLTSATTSPTPTYSAPSISFTAAKNITTAVFSGFIGTTIAKFTYSALLTDQYDQLTISGLYVKNVSATSADNIFRSGTGIIAGADDSKSMGLLTPGGAPSADYTVASSPNQTPITPTETNFSVNSQAILLSGEVPAGTAISGGSFSGTGVSYQFFGNPINAYKYTFNPADLAVGAYPVTFTYADPSTGCISSKTKTLNVSSSSINGLQTQYCVNNSTTQSLSVNPLYVPSGYSVTNFSIRFPIDYSTVYINFTNVVNNGTTLTLTAPNHGLTAGLTYPVYINGGFSGPDAPYGYIYGNFTISNVTTNTFDITATVTGGWSGYGYLYKDPNPTVTNVVNNGTSLTITAANHGLQNGAKIYITIDDLSIDGINPYFYGWYTVSNATPSTFDVAVVATGTWTATPNYVYTSIDAHTYEISSFTPNMALTLNSNLTNVTEYYVGFFLRYNSCTDWSSCNEFVQTEEHVSLNSLPVVDFTGLSSSYCVNNITPSTLTATTQPDGDFTANPNFGLTDGGPNDPTASFLASTSGITTESNIAITYTYTDANNCTNSVTKNTIVHSLPVVDAGASTSICNGTNTTLGGAPTATGNGPFGYTWDNTASLDKGDIPNPVATPISNTTYNLVVVDVNGCTATDNIVITVAPQPLVDAGTTGPVCSSSSYIDITTIGANYSGSATSATWSTSGDGIYKDGSGTGNINFGTAVRYYFGANDYANGGPTLTLTTNDPPGPCTPVSDQVVVKINPAAISSPGSDQKICGNQTTIFLNGTVSGSATTGTWTTNGGAGNASISNSTITNGSSTTSTYTPTATELLGSSITFTLTTDDPPGSCPPDSKFITVQIYGRPTVNAGVDQLACPGSINLNGTLPTGSTATSTTWSFTSSSSSPGSIYSPGSLTTTYTPSSSETTSASQPSQTDLTFTLTSNTPASPSPCLAETSTIKVTLYPTPPPPISGGDPQYCFNDQIKDLTASGTISGSTINWYKDTYPSTRLFVGLSYPPTGVSNTVDKQTYFYATQTAYATQSFSGCEGTPTMITLTVNPLPLPNFSADKFCLKDFMEFTDLTTISKTTNPARDLQYWQWDFGDGDVLLSGTGAIPAGTHNDRTVNTYQNPMHQYQNVGSNYNVKLTVTSNQGCVNSVFANQIATNPYYPNQALRVGPVPKANFKFDFICDTDNTRFLYTGTNAAAISTWAWDFGDSGTSAIKNPTHTYAGVGSYPATLTVITDLNCSDTVSRTVSILPYVKTFPYIETFESPGHGWFTEGLNTNGLTSWQLTQPSGATINTAADGVKAWYTYVDSLGTYFINERSVLNGPCIDVTQLPRPALSFSYWDNTDNRNDGAYMEYSIDDGINWTTLGGIGKGLNWYNEGLIRGLTTQNGVGQDVGQIGWSGDTKGWITGKLSLEALKSQSKLRVRFVFGSNQDKDAVDGFAIDHFKLDSLNRVMLVENFTSEIETANNTAYNNFMSAITNDAVVKLQYHTGLTGPDAIYDENRTDPNARVAYYGITNTDKLIPRGYLDGFSDGDFTKKLADNVTLWTDNYFDVHSLEDAPFAIKAGTVASSNPGVLSVSVAYQSLDSLSRTARPVLQVVVVEKQIGTDEYVVRKMLPSPVGTSLQTPMGINKADTLVMDWQVDNASIDPSQLAIVAFIQDRETKKVYQSTINLNPTNLPTVITGLEHDLSKSIKLYPNPADQILTLELPEPAKQQTILKMMDVTGQELQVKTMQKGERIKIFNTQELTAGVYIVQLETGNNLLTKKVMVIHK